MFRSFKIQPSDVVRHWFLYCANVYHKRIMLVLLVMILITKANLLSHTIFIAGLVDFKAFMVNDLVISIIRVKSYEFGKIKLLIYAFTNLLIKFISFNLLFVIIFGRP